MSRNPTERELQLNEMYIPESTAKNTPQNISKTPTTNTPKTVQIPSSTGGEMASYKGYEYRKDGVISANGVNITGGQTKLQDLKKNIINILSK